MDPILNLNQFPSLAPVVETGRKPVSAGQGAAEGSDFSAILKQALQEVDAAQHTSEQEARNLMSGEATDMHTAILAVQKADVSFQMMMAVRSKLIDAYREVMRMQM